MNCWYLDTIFFICLRVLELKLHLWAYTTAHMCVCVCILMCACIHTRTRFPVSTHGNLSLATVLLQSPPPLNNFPGFRTGFRAWGFTPTRIFLKLVFTCKCDDVPLIASSIGGDQALVVLLWVLPPLCNSWVIFIR